MSNQNCQFQVEKDGPMWIITDEFGDFIESFDTRQDAEDALSVLLGMDMDYNSSDF